MDGRFADVTAGSPVALPAIVHRSISSSADAGSTLAELLVAVLLLVLLASGLATLLGTATRTLFRSRVEAAAILAAQSRLEELRALAWGYGSAYDPASGVDTTTSLAGRQPGSGGNGLRQSPPGALVVDTIGYVDYLDHAGDWLAGGTTPPPGARFIRRWRVSHAGAFPGLLILQVRVIDRRRDLADVSFATMRTRTAG